MLICLYIQFDNFCSQCRNGGRCLNAEATACTCPHGFTGLYCETRVPLPSRRPQSPIDPCLRTPCRNGGTCKPDNTAASDRNGRLNYTCDCPLHFAGANCQMCKYFCFYFVVLIIFMYRIQIKVHFKQFL